MLGKLSRKCYTLSCHSDLSGALRNCARNRRSNSTHRYQNTLEINKPQGWFSRHCQFLTFAVIDYALYTFPVIYHLFYLPFHAYYFGRVVVLEINAVVHSVLPGERSGTKGG